MKCRLFHNWSKWELRDFTKHLSLHGGKNPSVTRNVRVCQRCGLTETRAI